MDYNHELRKIETNKKLRSLFKDFTDLSDEILTEFSKLKNIPFSDYYKVVFHNLLQRLHLNIRVINNLFDSFNKQTYDKFPIAIIMRVCVLDGITVIYLKKHHDPLNQNKFIQAIARLNKKDAKSEWKKLKNKFDNKEIELLLYQEQCKVLSSFFPGNFSDDNTFLFKDDVKTINTKMMTDNLSDFQLEGAVSDWSNRVYGLYSYYSKCEHYGSISKLLLEKNSDYEFDNFCVCYIFCFANCLHCFRVYWGR